MNPVTASMVHVVGLEVRRGIDVPRRVVVGLKGALERVVACTASRRGCLLGGSAAHLVAHQAVVVFVDLLTSPDPVSNQGKTRQHDEATNTDDDANDGVLGLGAHAAAARGVVACEGSRFGGAGCRARR